ncbi:MAG: transketolase [Deltaproteobacteria bacterium]|nr:transketolase [Deltaproteobacteria bacterium]
MAEPSIHDAESVPAASLEALAEKARLMRQAVFQTICNGGGGHIPSSLSIIELLVVLYHRTLRIDPSNPADPDRDRFILSKGHACVSLYAALAMRGFFDHEMLETFGQKNTILGGHPDMLKISGVESSTGALGHGFPFGVGHALAGKIDGRNYRTFVILGDGECQEGSVWEAALFAPQQELDNLVAIIDHNRLQALDQLTEIVGLGSLAQKFEAFGWAVKEVDGHNLGRLIETFDGLPFVPKKPNLIVAHTTKGKGVSFMENEPIWHYRMPNPEEMEQACNELGIEKQSMHCFGSKR